MSGGSNPPQQSRYRATPVVTLSVRNVTNLGQPGLASSNPASLSPSPPAAKTSSTQLGCEGGPTAWDSSISQHPSMRYLEVTGLRVKYKGPGSDDRDAASIRTNNPIPQGCPVFYFEVEIVNKGRDGYIGIGLSVKDVKLDRLPGWEPNSYGYHGDDGHGFNGRGTGRPYGPVYTTGDWIGVIYDRFERTITFTKKGFQLGPAFQNVPENNKFYPTVGFRTPDEEIVVNFGDDLDRRPFKGDYRSILDGVVSNLYRAVLNTKVPSENTVIPELVFDYLQHHGYWETAQIVGHDILKGARTVSEAAKEESTALSGVTEFVMQGDSMKALEAAEALKPGLSERNPGIAFALKAQVLCELISAKKDSEAMIYGREVLVPAAKTKEDTKLLDSTLCLFAYTDPENSPHGWLLSTSHKTELAASLARCLRKELGKREVSTLEEIYRQSCCLHGLLDDLNDPSARVIDVANFIDQAI